MPLPMVHLNVAKKILDWGFSVNNLSQFYLGIISPDAIHMRKNTNSISKNRTHLIPEGKKWIDINEKEYWVFMLDFIKANVKNFDNDFLWGYGIHILTDMYWYNLIYNSFIEKYRKDLSPNQDERSAYYNDTDILDQLIFNESDWRNNVWACIQSANSFDFLDLLSANEINLWKERTLHWFDNKDFQKNSIKYILKSDIDKFIFSCSELIWNKIKNINKK